MFQELPRRRRPANFRHFTISVWLGLAALFGLAGLGVGFAIDLISR